jgi:hypothetical protein
MDLFDDINEIISGGSEGRPSLVRSKSLQTDSRRPPSSPSPIVPYRPPSPSLSETSSSSSEEEEYTQPSSFGIRHGDMSCRIPQRMCRCANICQCNGDMLGGNHVVKRNNLAEKKLRVVEVQLKELLKSQVKLYKYVNKLIKQ